MVFSKRQFARLKRGAQEWNWWRQENHGIEIKLSGANLNLTFPVKSKIQQRKHLDPLSGKALRHNSLDRRK
jgi:hypothetical protein